jgi:hypothetical protein
MVVAKGSHDVTNHSHSAIPQQAPPLPLALLVKIQLHGRRAAVLKTYRISILLPYLTDGCSKPLALEAVERMGKFFVFSLVVSDEEVKIGPCYNKLDKIGPIVTVHTIYSKCSHLLPYYFERG